MTMAMCINSDGVFISDNQTCLDVDECAEDNGLCQQICINQV